MKITNVLAVLVACLLSAFALPATAQSSTGSDEATPIEAARRQGDVQRLRQLAGTLDDAEALAARAELALLDGEIANAKSLGMRAYAVETATAETRERALVAAARAMFELGEADAAVAKLREHLNAAPQAHRVRLRLGELLLERGSEAEGELVLDAFSAFFNNSLLKTSEELTILSKAMAALGSYQDANYAMEKAIQTNPYDGQALVQWGDLLLSKYNMADAREVYQEALTLNESNVDALVGLAQTELESSNDYVKVRSYLEKAERLAPEHVGLLLTRAEVAVADTDCDAARGYADDILEHRPRNLEALTFHAVCAYLDDDKAGFQAAKKKVLTLNPRYARVLTETARFAVRAHRYVEATALDREALTIVPDDGAALVGLGIGLSRVGAEDEALQMFRRAYEVDPYNVRAFNMLELYEEEMKDYEFTEFDRFRIRAHRSENEAIVAMVEPVVHSAMETFDDKYGFQPASDYLAVEIYPNPQTFSVRSVGLPAISLQGVCFGKVVVSRSPSEGTFNWRQVVWHEMAHVYHLQLSNSRVPRWFTEGLAEYETNVKDPAWSRYHDQELASALQSGSLRGVLELSEGFTHARSQEEVLRSYHQSSLVIHFIAQTWGFSVIPTMLRKWGEYEDTPDVLKGVLGVSAAEFDAKFESWLSARYLNFRRQLTVDVATLPTVVELEDEVSAGKADALEWAHLAIARFRSGDVQNADLAMKQATKLGPDDAEVNMLATYYYMALGRVKDSYRHGMNVLDAGRDSYDLRVTLGLGALQLEDVASAHVHFHSATQLWADGAEAWEGLSRVARATDDATLSDLAARRLFELNAHDASVARERARWARENQLWREAWEGARRWFDISPMDARASEALAEAAMRTKRPDDAVDAWAVLAVLRPDDSAEILRRGIEELVQQGFDPQAERLAVVARRSGLSDDAIRKALE